MKNVDLELIAKAKSAKSAEELLALAKANGVELTEKEAETYFEQFHANAAVSDDDLEAVSGGLSCGGEDDDSSDTLAPKSSLDIGNQKSDARYG